MTLSPYQVWRSENISLWFQELQHLLGPQQLAFPRSTGDRVSFGGPAAFAAVLFLDFALRSSLVILTMDLGKCCSVWPWLKCFGMDCFSAISQL